MRAVAQMFLNGGSSSRNQQFLHIGLNILAFLWSASRKLPGGSREAPDTPDAPSIFRAVLQALARRQRSQNSLPATNTVPTSTAETPKDFSLGTQRLCGPVATTFGHLPSLSMSERELQSLLHQTQQSLDARDYQAALEHVNRAKLALLSLNALVPSRDVPQSTLILAREILELAALMSIRRHDHDGFTRYYSQLQPFYDLTPAQLSSERSHRSKVTGLYLLLLLSQGDYAGFHTVLESLELAVAPTKDGQQMNNGTHGIEIDAFIQYPIKLEQWLMEGSYDRVWSGTKSEKVPSEEYGIFSDVLIGTIRSEIASCSERAYVSLPITNAKILLFLESEGSVIEFAQSRGWTVRDGRIHFPSQSRGVGAEKEILLASGQVIENTLGYARELETIV